jgi:SAM-dependent methyltransferase
MSAYSTLVQSVRNRARSRRASIFRRAFDITPNTRILDIGSDDGSAIAQVLEGTPVRPSNVYIADISADRVAAGQRRYGFVPVPIPESGRLPFEAGHFDIVYCSSVIEHVTVPKEAVWEVRSGREFRQRAERRQREFAQEIRRLGKAYYVQTPNKWFPIESHTWFPFVGFMPRRLQIGAISLINRWWVKGTSPDWLLLTARDMRDLFPDAEVCRERFLGLTKSIMAIRRAQGPG